MPLHGILVDRIDGDAERQLPGRGALLDAQRFRIVEVERDRQRRGLLLAHRINYIDAGPVFIELDEQRTVEVLLPQLAGLGPAHEVGNRAFLFDLAADRVEDRHLGRLAHIGRLVVGAGAFAEHARVAVVEADEAHARRLQLAGDVDVVDARLAGGRQRRDVVGRDVKVASAPFVPSLRVKATSSRARAVPSAGGRPNAVAGPTLPAVFRAVETKRVQRRQVVGLVAADDDDAGVSGEQLHLGREQVLDGRSNPPSGLPDAVSKISSFENVAPSVRMTREAFAVGVEREDIVEVTLAGRRLQHLLRLERLRAPWRLGRGHRSGTKATQRRRRAGSSRAEQLTRGYTPARARNASIWARASGLGSMNFTPMRSSSGPAAETISPEIAIGVLSPGSVKVRLTTVPDRQRDGVLEAQAAPR